MNKNTLTTEEWVSKARLVHGNVWNYSKVNYIKSTMKVEIVCPQHGSFWQKANSHIHQKCGCYECGHLSTAKNKTLTQTEFLKKCKQIHKNRYDYSKAIYLGLQVKLEIICKKHGSFFQVPANHIYGNQGCPKCGKDILSDLFRLTKDDFIQKSKKIHGDHYDYSLVDYVKSNIKVEIICKKHGTFEQSPNSHLNRSGCPICKTSKGELKIIKWLKFTGIDYIRQKRFDDCRGKKRSLPFDFFIPNRNTLIEFDGKQHSDPNHKWYSENIIKTDAIKTKYASDNGYNLIRIPFTKINDIELILGKGVPLL